MFRTSILAIALLAVPAVHADITSGPGDWPQWRGPDRTGVSHETGLLKTWPKNGPTKVWTVKGIGGGYGSPVVVGNRIYGLGKIDGKEQAWCLNAKDGSKVWEKEFASPGKVSYDEGPRCTPTFDADPKIGGRLYVLGVGGDLVCLDAATGEKVWSKNYGKDFNGRMMSGWGYSESPLVDGEKLIVTPGGDAAAIVALNKSTGETIWKAAVSKGGGAGYSSIVKAVVGGVPMYITLLGKSGGVVGVHADSGKELWRYIRINNSTANIPTVIFRDDLVWCSTGYGDGGSALLKLTSEGKDKVSVKELKYYNSSLQNHHGGMVLVGDYVYFGANHGEGFPACVEFKTGEIKYKLSKPLGGGGGSAAIAAADGMLYYRYQNGQMVLLPATPDENMLNKEAGSFKVPEPSGAAKWAHPVIAHGMLYLRDQDKLHCYNIKAEGN